MTARLAPRLATGLPTLLLWALLAASALWWWLRAGQPVAPPQAPVAGGAPAALTVDSAQVARALGATAAAPAAPAAAPELGGRLALKGVVTHGGQGAALIALDGKPARPLRVGALLEGVDGGWRLRAVSPHAAVLAADGRELRLEMPAPAARTAAVGVAPVAPPLPGAPMSPPPGAPELRPGNSRAPTAVPPMPTPPALPAGMAVSPQPQAYPAPGAAPAQ
ncbi:MAG TPA: type II secretion system protein N [Ottowia sp.]|nr:type II secretion system protein N [Ottowia sp.]